MNCDPFVIRSAAERSKHLLAITAGMHGSVAKLNLGIVSLLERLRRRGQGPFSELLTQAICTHLHTASSQDLVSQSCARFRMVLSFKHSGNLCAVGLHNNRAQKQRTMWSCCSRCCGACTMSCHLLQPQWPVCQTCDTQQQCSRGSMLGNYTQKHTHTGPVCKI